MKHTLGETRREARCDGTAAAWAAYVRLNRRLALPTVAERDLNIVRVLP
jgi:hypothetical protein